MKFIEESLANDLKFSAFREATRLFYAIVIFIFISFGTIYLN